MTDLERIARAADEVAKKWRSAEEGAVIVGHQDRAEQFREIADAFEKFARAIRHGR